MHLSIAIHTDSEEATSSQNDLGRIVPLQALSSGEKQIVSLFATLLLSSIEHFFLIIDEPELSLSVPWQKRLLPDMLDTGKVDGLIAATHSPFIFDNQLDPSTHGITEFTEVGHVASS